MKELSTKNPAWYDGFPDPTNTEKQCVYAFIAEDSKYDGAWGTSVCSTLTKDLVCELKNPLP